MSFAETVYNPMTENHQTLSPDEQCVLQSIKQQCKTVGTDSNFEHVEVETFNTKKKKIRKSDSKIIRHNHQKFHPLQSNGKHVHKIKMELDFDINMHNQKGGEIFKRGNRPIKKSRGRPGSASQEGGDFLCKKNGYQSTSTKSQNQTMKNVAFRGLKLVQDVAEGQVGYSTLMFKNKVIQGSYYIEFTVLETKTGLNYKYKPDIRLGVCASDHKLDTPLGYGRSIGFSFRKKQVIENGIRKNLSEMETPEFNISPGDTIGMLLEFSPPFRSPDKQKIWDGSRLTFFLNESKIGRYQGLKQMFYHPAVSLYSGSRVEIKVKAEKMRYLPSQSLPFEKISQFINSYK